MSDRRKTIELSELRDVVNTTIHNAATEAERDAAAHVFQAATLRYGNAYRGFMYVDKDGKQVSHEIIGSGAGYDRTRIRFY